MELQKLLSIDPSYSNTGLCLIDFSNKEITFKRVRPDGTNDSYLETVDRADKIMTEIFELLLTRQPNHIVQEEPLLTSQKSSVLGVLGGIITNNLLKMVDLFSRQNLRPYKYITINPRVVSSVCSKTAKKLNLTKKKASTHVGKIFLELLENKGFKVDVIQDTKRKRVISNDEYEALILAIVYLSQEHQDFFTFEEMRTIKGIKEKDYELNIKRGEITNDRY